MGVFHPQASDRAGRLYFENAGGIRKIDEGTYVPDSTLVDRFDLATGAMMTVGRLAPSSALKVVRVGKDLTLDLQPQSFEIADGWVVRDDGELLIVRVSDYHVDVRSADGMLRSAPSLQHQSRAPKITSSLAQVPVARTDLASRSSGIEDSSATRRVRPFFVANSAMLDSRGRLWVMRNEETGTVRRTYDVIGRGGQLLERVEMPRGVRLVGFGADVLFAARAVDAQHEVLQGYRM